MTDLTDEQRRDWNEWLSERPPAVRAVAEKYPPWETYTLTTTGQLAVILSYDEPEDGSEVTVSINAWREWLPLPRGVFGIDPADLVISEAAP